jgi:hypothetical protein
MSTTFGQRWQRMSLPEISCYNAVQYADRDRYDFEAQKREDAQHAKINNV